MGSRYRRKSDGRWVAAISIGPRGHQKRIVRYAATRKAADAALDDLRKLSRPTTGPRTTVGQYLRSWLDDAGRRSLKASTWVTYDVALRLHIDPAIGSVALSRLIAEHIDRMLVDSPLAPKGQRNVLGFLGRVLDVAQARGYVLRNAARLVEPPRLEPKEEPPALTPDDARRLLATIVGDRLEALWVLALATGMRQAELLGLRWDDVDLDAATVRVRFALARHAGQYVLEEPKTGKSRRTVALPALAVRALHEHRARQLEERVAAGRPTGEGLVFVSPEGRPLNAGWVSHRWPILAKAAGVDVTMHGLRHGQSSLLVALGVHPRVIAGRLGHATIAQTMDRYAHVVEASDRDVARLLDEAIG
jgi:integrase